MWRRIWKILQNILETKALFSSEKFWEIDTVALSFVFEKYCPIMN